MSAQPVESDLDLAAVSEDEAVQPSAFPESVEVRRNAAVSLVVGVAAASLAIAYLWRAASTGAPLDWLLCVVLAVLGTGFLRGLLDSRVPLLVADDHGVRIRLGSQWRGLPWEAVDRVVVKPRAGLLRDGKVTITLYQVARAIEGLDARARRHARLNQKLYGAPLVVPLGLTTRTNGGEEFVAARIIALVDGRTDVTVDTDAEPEPIVTAAEVTGEPVEADGVEERERRHRWKRRPPTVQMTSEVASVAEVPTLKVEEHAEPRRTLAFLRGRHGEAHVAPLEEYDETDLETVAPEPATEPSAPVGPANVRAIATLADPVGPLVIDDYRPEPAYDPVIGPELAAARTRVGLTVDQLAERTRIRPHVIESIEVDDFTPCGGDFYARGHIRTLARVLGKNAEAMVAEFDARYATAPVSPRKVFEAELAGGLTGGVRTPVGSGQNWLLLIGTVLLLVLVWSGVRLFAGEDNQMLETPPALNGSAGLGNVYGGPTAPAVEPVSTTVTAVTAGTSVEIRDAGGALVFEGDLVIGASKTVEVEPPVTVSSDNGGALSVRIDGKDVGFLGKPDQPATQTYQAR